MSFNTKLINLLKTDTRMVDDEGELIIAAAQDRAWKIDRDLVKLLLSDKEIKSKFFEEIEEHWIFNLNIFIEYISQKNFLDNSYALSQPYWLNDWREVFARARRRGVGMGIQRHGFRRRADKGRGKTQRDIF